jgi:hypothetical protein
MHGKTLYRRKFTMNFKPGQPPGASQQETYLDLIYSAIPTIPSELVFS